MGEFSKAEWSQVLSKSLRKCTPPPRSAEGVLVLDEQSPHGCYEGDRSALVRPDAYITLYESELRAIAADAVAWGTCETGGELWGLYTRGGRQVMLYATGPGASAIHKPGRFEQPADQFGMNSRTLWERYAIQFCGNWHSHPGGYGRLSADDVNNTLRLANRNGLSRVVQIVVTHELRGKTRRSRESTDPTAGFVEAAALESRKPIPLLSRLLPAPREAVPERPRVRVRAFVHSGLPDSPQCEEVCIRLLPGTSPFRSALESDPSPEAGQVSKLSGLYPLDLIAWTAAKERSSGGLVPSWLEESAASLPPEAQRALSATPQEGSILVHMGVFKDYYIQALYDAEAPMRVRSVAVVHAGKTYDLTARVLGAGSALGLAEIYSLCWREMATQLVTSCQSPSEFIRTLCDSQDEHTGKDESHVESV